MKRLYAGLALFAMSTYLLVVSAIDRRPEWIAVFAVLGVLVARRIAQDLRKVRRRGDD